jgi:hypothetical protein
MVDFNALVLKNKDICTIIIWKHLTLINVLDILIMYRLVILLLILLEVQIKLILFGDVKLVKLDFG